MTCSIFIAQVLHAGEEAIGIEQLDEDVDDITRGRFTRRHGNMSSMSGADGRLYYEYRCVPQHRNGRNTINREDKKFYILEMGVMLKVLQPTHCSPLNEGIFCPLLE